MAEQLESVGTKPKITLYWLENSRSQRIVWLLEALGLDYELKIFHRNPTTMLAPPELAAIHPLGKSPVLTISNVPGHPETAPLVLAESGLITEYLAEHFSPPTSLGSPSLVPPRWRSGAEGQIGGETEEYMRYRYFMHYAEGSLMPILLLSLILGRLKGQDVPFFIRPLSAAIANKIIASFVFPNAVKHLDFLEQQLATAPGRAASGEGQTSAQGPFLCGQYLTAADILMSFPLMAGETRFAELGEWEGGSPRAKHPLLFNYLEKLREIDSFRRAMGKVEALEGKGKTMEGGGGIK